MNTTKDLLNFGIIKVTCSEHKERHNYWFFSFRKHHKIKVVFASEFCEATLWFLNLFLNTVIHLNKRRVYKVLTSKHYRSTNPGQFKHCEKNEDFQNELRILSPALFNAWYIKYIPINIPSWQYIGKHNQHNYYNIIHYP